MKCKLASFHHFKSELIVQEKLFNVQENDVTEHDSSFFFCSIFLNLVIDLQQLQVLQYLCYLQY